MISKVAYNIFTLFDSDCDGSITCKELKKMLTTLGLGLRDKEMKELILSFKLNSGDRINFVDFLNIIASKRSNADAEQDLIDAFKVFDHDRDGFVTADNLRTVMKRLTSHLRDNDYDDLVHNFDTDGDGKLNFEEFCSMVTSEESNLFGFYVV